MFVVVIALFDDSTFQRRNQGIFEVVDQNYDLFTVSLVQFVNDRFQYLAGSQTIKVCQWLFSKESITQLTEVLEDVFFPFYKAFDSHQGLRHFNRDNRMHVLVLFNKLTLITYL